jgi:hypothetical protein
MIRPLAALLALALVPGLASAALPSSARPVRGCATPEPGPLAGAMFQARVNAWLKQPHTEAGGEIRVAFHVLYDPATGLGNLSDEQIAAQIEALNRGYAGTGFRFVLDSTSRTGDKRWFRLTPGGVEKKVKKTLAVDPAHRLNIYTGDLGKDLLGWAYFPDAAEDNPMHGVVFHYASLPGGALTYYNEGETLTHEVGHYLGLFHTFQGGCTEPGDYVDDTPAEASPYVDTDCTLARDTCPSPGLDPISNFMDYSVDACLTEFTRGQKERMQALTAQYRPSLFERSARAVDVAMVRPAVSGSALSFAGALPNPSHGGTTLEYALTRATVVALRLYSVSGRLVATLAQGTQDAGPHRVALAGRALAPGTYFAVLAADGHRLTRTVILR